MTGTWPTKPLGEILERTETVNPETKPETEFDYVDVSSVSNVAFEITETQRLLGKDAPSRARKLIRKDDVLFATIRPTLRRIAMVPEELDGQVCSTGYFVLRAKSGLEPRFLFHALFRTEFNRQMEKLQKGASYPAVTDGDVRAQSIPLPPLPEQRRIVGILDEAFAGIATAKANAEKNLQNARALFESHLHAVFTHRGPGWVETTVGGLMNRTVLAAPIDGNHGEIHPKKADFVADGVPFLMASDLKGGVVDQESCYFISRKQAGSLRKGFAKDGDVLLSHKGTIGRVALLRTDHDYVMLTPQVTYYRIIDPKTLLNEFLFFALQAPEFVNLMNHIAGAGSTRAYIGITKQQELPVAFPPLEQQKRFAVQLDALQTETRRLEALYARKLAALDELKSALLHQAFSGQL